MMKVKFLCVAEIELADNQENPVDEAQDLLDVYRDHGDDGKGTHLICIYRIKGQDLSTNLANSGVELEHN